MTLFAEDINPLNSQIVYGIANTEYPDGKYVQNFIGLIQYVKVNRERSFKKRNIITLLSIKF